MARAAEQLRRLLPLVWLCALPMFAHAQPEPEPAAPSPAPPAADAEQHASQNEPSAERSRLVLFVLPADASESQPLRDALLAQFALIDARLVFETERGESESSLSRRLTLAQQLAAERGAIAVFWIDHPSDGRWLLHMMDAHDERVIVRAVDATGERRPAAIEAIAVMTRSSTRALLEDQSSQPAPPPAAPATPAPAPSAEAARKASPDWVRLWVGYTGDYFAPDVWQHGIAFGGGFLRLSPLYASVGITLMPAIDFPDDPATDFPDDPARFSVRRLPFALRAGYRLVADALSLDAELGLLLEWLHRPPSEARQILGASVTAHDAHDAFLWALGPRLRAELRVVPTVGLYAGGGLDVLLSDFAYVSDEVGVSDARILLQPKRLRPVAELGISFYP